MSDSQPLNHISPQHLLTLFDITRTITSSLEFDEVLNTVMDSVMQITKAQRGFLMIADEDARHGVEAGDGRHLRVVVARGLDESKHREEIPYSTTVVREVVAQQQSLLTNNAQFDDRYTAGESIIMRGLRAILCAPMLTKGRLVGVIYVDSALRSGMFTQDDLSLLDAVAGQAAIAIENARLYRVAVEKGRLERELQMAREIQESLLPHRMPVIPGFDVAARWRSAREVAGDFYDAFLLSDDALGLVIADVSDKGAPAALFMAAARSMIRSHAFVGMSPLETLYQTNELILADAESGMFVTVYYSLLRSDGASVQVNAGHNPPLLYRRQQNMVERLPRGGRALGWFSNNPLRLVELQFQPGDVIVYYTDGLTDAENPQGKEYGEERLSRALMECAGEDTAEQMLDYIVGSVDAFSDGVPAFDDVTLCVVRYTG